MIIWVHSGDRAGMAYWLLYWGAIWLCLLGGLSLVIAAIVVMVMA